MKICNKHWTMCREAIENRGLTHLVRSGQDNMERAVVELEGEKPDPDTYDPLMALNYMLWGHGMNVLGLGAMYVDESKADDDLANNGHVCPLCEARKGFDYHNTPTGRCDEPKCTIQIEPGSKPWDLDLIDGASDSILDHCRKTGLVKTQ